MISTIDDIQAWLGASLPDGYRQFLEEQADDFDASDLVLLCGRSSFVECNETYETKEYCPEFVTIDNDSGDMEFILWYAQTLERDAGQHFGYIRVLTTRRPETPHLTYELRMGRPARHHFCCRFSSHGCDN